MKCCCMVWVLGALLTTGVGTAQSADTFTNPVLPSGADPWVFQWKGQYYFIATSGKNLTLRKTADMSDLSHAEKKVVWTPEPGNPGLHAIWAPEITRWGDRWYIYFAATDAGPNDRRVYVIENTADDPLDGTWVMKGKVADATDRWAIDADVFEVKGVHYLLWSGWPGAENGTQNIYIARLKNPWTIDSPRTLISTPTYPWELHAEGLKNGQVVHVNEGPEALLHGGTVFVTYSASGCWTDSYALGVLAARADANLLAASSWKKYDHPFLSTDAAAHAFSPGHNGFFKSPDGKQDWIVYHANAEAGEGCGSKRSTRIQRFTWNADGTPNFGKPAAVDVPLEKPSGTK